jgi:hypothetical protein
VIHARIRNFTELSADVTLRFELFAKIVRLTVLRVPGNTSTTVIGPEEADLLEVSGVAEDGTALPEIEFRYGEDFFAGTEAVYIIGIQGDTAVPPVLIFLQPTEDIELAAGDQLKVTIADEDRDSSALIDFYLDPLDAQPTEGDGGTEVGTSGAEPGPGVFGFDGDETVLATGLEEDLDGDGDSFSLTVPEDLRPGDYWLVGVISDELATSIVRAPGLVRVDEAGESPPTEAEFGVINASIRNFTDLSADVTLRYELFAETVRSTFVRVPGNTSSTVVGPEEADLLEVSGVAEDGTALPEVEFRYGEDVFAGTEAVYIIGIQGDTAEEGG